MKAILEFNFPDDNYAYQLAIQAANMHSCLFELREYLRGQLKYAERSQAEKKVLQEIRDHLHELMSENRVELG